MERNRNNTPENNDDDQLRPNTANESIREAAGDEDLDLNILRDSDDSDEDVNVNDSTFSDEGMTRNPSDPSGVRSGGYNDMDDQARGLTSGNAGSRAGGGSGLTSKKIVTGSDYDGQNSSS